MLNRVLRSTTTTTLTTLRNVPRTTVLRHHQIIPRNFYATEVPPSDKSSATSDSDATAKSTVEIPNTTGPRVDGNSDIMKLLQDAEESPSSSTSSASSSEGYKSTADRKRERMANVLFGLFLAGAAGGILYLGVETPESDVKGYTPGAWWQRVKHRFVGQVQYYTEPAFSKLLPDPLPAPYQRPFTLVLDLDDLLITSTWTRERGWRTAKRPGLDYFLSYLSQYYEIVIFTNQYGGTALPIIEALDPYRSSISASLFRESARYENGKVIKDLSYMNRPLEHIIMLDTNPDAVSAQPENAILLKPWKGEVGAESNAQDLIGYLPFLEYLAAMEVNDVRPVIKGYEGTHIPTEYARREQELRDKIAASRTSSSRASFFGGAGSGGAKKSNGKVEIFMDQQRARAQQAHKEYMQYLRENGPKMLKEQKEKEAEMMAEQKTSMMGYLLGDRPTGPQQQQQQQQQQQG